MKLERSEEGCSTSHDKSVEPNGAFLNSVSNISTNSSAREEDSKVANFFLGKMDIVKQENLYPGTGKLSPPTSNGASPKKTKSSNEGNVGISYIYLHIACKSKNTTELYLSLSLIYWHTSQETKNIDI